MLTIQIKVNVTCVLIVFIPFPVPTPDLSTSPVTDSGMKNSNPMPTRLFKCFLYQLNRPFLFLMRWTF